MKTLIYLDNEKVIGINVLDEIVNDPMYNTESSFVVDSDTPVTFESGYDLFYNVERGFWKEPLVIPEEITSVDESDIQAEMLLNQVDILINQEFIQDVLSQILLNQIDGV